MFDPKKRANISGVIERWQQNLLDLTRRNRLLFFKPSKTVVRLLETGPDRLIERLSARKGLSFDYAERRSQPDSLSIIGTESDQQDEESDITIISGDLTVDCAPLELQKRLRGLQRKDTEWDQEQGIKVLHLALGFIKWIDEDGFHGKAPLLLLPATLRRRSPKDPFHLHRDSDEPEVNRTLTFRMSQLGIELPELGDLSVSSYLEYMENAVEKRKEWSVDSDIFLSTFAYNKLAIWQDLEHLSRNGVKHPLVLNMASQVQQDNPESNSGSGTPSAFPPADQLKGGKLDDLIGLRDQITVINADYSQLEAIQSSRRGQDLVIHGPPGTGKSQTITNIISALIADGKKVLFVSEKRSALDVVKRNLESCNLGVLCLDLHSQYGRKAEVYKQIKTSLSVDHRTRPIRAGRIDELNAYRNQLNQYVRALHETRKPFGRSVFQIAGIYASVQHLPAVECNSLSWIPDLNEARYINISQMSDRIGSKKKQFTTHETNPWRPLKATSYYLGLGDEILRNLEQVRVESTRLREAGIGVARKFGLKEPQRIIDSDNLRQLCDHFTKAPGVLRSWLNPICIDNYIRETQFVRSQSRELQELEQATNERFGDRRTWPEFDELYSKLMEVRRPEISNTIGIFLGSKWKDEIPLDLDWKTKILDDLHNVFLKLNDDIDEVKSHTGGYPADNWINLSGMCSVGKEIVELCPVPMSWVFESDQIAHKIGKIRDLSTEVTNRKHKLAEVFIDSFLGAVDPTLSVRYRTNYQDVFKIFRPQYWRDRRHLRGYMKSPQKMSVSESLTWINEALETKEVLARWNTEADTAEALLGRRFNGLDTDWRRTESALQNVINMVSDWPCGLSELSELLTNSDRMHSLRLTIGRLDKNLRLIEDHLSSLGREFPDSISPVQMVDTSATAVHALKDVASVLESMSLDQQTRTIEFVDLQSHVYRALHLTRIEKIFETKTTQLSEMLGQTFRAKKTNWQELENKLSWAKKTLGYLSENVPSEFAEECESPKPVKYYEELADMLSTSLTEVVSVHFDATNSKWKEWKDAPFRELDGWIDYLAQNSNEVADWIEYQTISSQVEDVFGPGTISRIRELTEDASLIPGILRKVVAENWLNSVQMSDPFLKKFSASNHETVWNQFRELDKQLPAAIREEVRRKCFERYPVAGQGNQFRGQIGILNRETSKKRRQMPVRQLLEQVPTLIHTLKPCFLMSPLAVSQFLPIMPGTFDVVIFDEASQVFPEDAIPSIFRSNQCIVVGDRKQLPPTSFFRRTESDDEDEDHIDDEDFLAGMESILDAMVGLVGRGRVAEQYLRIHYRSRNEYLIQFSNHWFYSERPLLVFPGPQVSSITKVLTTLYVKNGVYTPTQRINHNEAEQVVDVVMELMEKLGSSESIGVVAMSRTQSDYIQHRVDMRRMTLRHLDSCFDEELREPFFVKNLENVQGDERDHIVLGIGYGPLQEGGRTPNRFGALNLVGAGRRLNVAISRARKTMTVVHSVKDSDITSDSEGARLLKSYLQYAANPKDFFAKESRIAADGEPESPFEESVIAALKEIGYSVHPQVGVAGYRVDIGVLSKDGDRYILGIECDGFTYHSSPASRDRDWLRQSILEGLGWKIHRVWSTAWVQNPKGELMNIEKAIGEARSAQSLKDTTYNTTQTSPLKKDNDPKTIQTSHPSNALVDSVPVASKQYVTPSNFQPYKIADLSEIYVNIEYDLAETNIAILRRLISEIVSVEMPIRSDCIVRSVRDRWNLRRAGNRIRVRVIEAINSTVKDGLLIWDPSTKTGPVQKRFVISPNSSIVPRKPVPGQQPRSIDEVSKTEIAEGILDVVRVLHGGSRSDLISQTAKGFGYDYVGSKISERIGEVLDSQIVDGVLRYMNDVIVSDLSE